MIRTEVYRDGLIRTYSDIGKKITRDGQVFEEAVDPENSGRTYTELEEYIEDTGAEATQDDLEQALREVGVL